MFTLTYAGKIQCDRMFEPDLEENGTGFLQLNCVSMNITIKNIPASKDKGSGGIRRSVHLMEMNFPEHGKQGPGPGRNFEAATGLRAGTLPGLILKWYFCYVQLNISTDTDFAFRIVY